MRIFLLLFVLVAGTVTSAQSPADDKASAFLTELQRAAARNDRQAMAALLRFPITVDVGAGLRVPIADPKAFAQQYDAVVTPALRDTIAGASLKPGARVRVTVSSDQLVIGTNVVVASAAGGTFKIVSMAVPPPKAGGGSSAPRRISPRAGPDPTQLSGALAGNATDGYLIRAAKGQLIEVRITGVQGRDIVARVVDSSGAPVDARAAQGARAWSGRVTTDGDYRIDVSRTTAGSDALPYMLSVRVR